ncbi:hypothetical protein EIN_095800 [Entamoeba invadens IP1]|uniref:Rho-GAP domain-containing protein n=1 Tax=Entamoeba invadens IP1 TaxID=370355 RepID=A0A0A1U3K6_ENTIV|nr:hypothetical protein EIN_095800 [Entamoeba invadens IP1]ELP87323.1 hypothetical protein EIN_095800 [Entamoeba invadens IP1]|eukprot:XP_004254094.1 hypothetical protein EIN_095800 [Entamoeba invadens IP1]
MLKIIEQYIGNLLEKPETHKPTIAQELSDTRMESKRALYFNILKNTLDLLNIKNKGYTQVFMSQLANDMKRMEPYQTLPLLKQETLLLTNIVNDIGYRFNSDDCLQKVVKTQSLVRGALYHKRYITHKTFNAPKFQQYNSAFLNLCDKQNHYVDNIKTLVYYFDELRAQPQFSLLNEYPYKDYNITLNAILDIESGLKNGLTDVNGTFPKVSGVGEVVLKYCEKAQDIYKELSLQGAVVMALSAFEKKNKEFKEAEAMLSKGQVYPFRYLLQSFPRNQHIAQLISMIETMRVEAKKLPEYSKENEPLQKCEDQLKKINTLISDTVALEAQMQKKDAEVEISFQNPEFSALLMKVKKEFTKTPSVVEVYLKLGLDISDIEKKRFLKERRVTVEVHPNINLFPPNLKTSPQNSSNLSLSTGGQAEKKVGNSLRPKITKRTERQKAEAKAKATGELKKEIEILTNTDLEGMKFEATLFVMNDVIFVGKMDKSEQYHVLCEIPMNGSGFSVSNYQQNKFNMGSRVVDFTMSLYNNNTTDARELFLLLREVFFVFTPPKIFGASLDDILEKEGNTTGIPFCIKSLGDYLLEPNNIQLEGLFRKSPSQDKVSQLRHILDQMPDKVTSLVEYSPHDIASTFKKFFNELEMPLFAPEIVEKLLGFLKQIDEAPEDPDSVKENKENIKKTMKDDMKPMYFKLTNFLAKVLKLTCDNEKVTLMSPKAISICVGPTIFRMSVGNTENDKDNGTAAVADTQLANKLLELLITDYTFFFG